MKLKRPYSKLLNILGTLGLIGVGLCTLAFPVYSIDLPKTEVTLSDSFQREILGEAASFFEDQSAKLTFEQLLAPSIQAQFQQSYKKFLSFGYTNSVYWVRLKFNNTNLPRSVFVEVVYPLLDEIEMHQLGPSGEVAHKTVGNEIVYSQREISHRTFVLNLQVPSGSSTLYLKFRTPGYMNFPLVLWEPSVFYQSAKKEYLVFGFYLGIVILLSLFSLFIFFQSKKKSQEKGYLYLFLLSVNYFLWLGTILGFTIEGFCQNFTPVVKYFFIIVCFGVSFFELQFLKHFLVKDRGNLFINRAISILVLFPVSFAILSPFLKYQFLIRWAALFAIISFSVEILVGIYFSFKRYSPAYFYICAKLIMQLTTSFNIFISFQLYNYGLYVPWLMLFGSLFEGILFLIAMMSKVRLSKEERLKFETLQKEHQIAQEKIGIYTQVAHDIRSPLVALNLVKQHLGPLDEDIRILLRSAVERVSDIANSILVKRESLEKKEIDLPQHQVFPIASILEVLVTEKKIEYSDRKAIKIQCLLDPLSYGLYAQVKISEFKRAISNLINNSIESVGGSGIVEVRVGWNEGSIFIVISDNGIGISEEHLSQLGTKGVTWGKNKGSGLGVFFAKSVIESFRGTLKYSSIEGQGTTLAIELPTAAAPSWFVPSIEVNQNTSLVILDDDKTIHQIWIRRFAHVRHSLNLQIFHFYSADELIQWHRMHRSSENTLFLIDFELGVKCRTGLDVIYSLGIEKNSILVSSHFYNEIADVNQMDLKIRLVPKNLTPFIPIVERKN